MTPEELLKFASGSMYTYWLIERARLQDEQKLLDKFSRTYPDEGQAYRALKPAQEDLRKRKKEFDDKYYAAYELLQTLIEAELKEQPE
jgi:hypothetical protein